jgi:hypothetical protein
MGASVESGVATSETRCWSESEPCCTVLFRTSALRYFGVKPLLPLHVALSTRISNCLVALLSSLSNSAKYNIRRYDALLLLFMKESELHVMSIRVPLAGVAAFCSISVGLSKLLVFETSMVAFVFMLVHAATSPNFCHMRS